MRDKSKNPWLDSNCGHGQYLGHQKKKVFNLDILRIQLRIVYLQNFQELNGPQMQHLLLRS